MSKSIAIAIAATILSLGARPALAQMAPTTTAETSKGKALVSGKGMTRCRKIELQWSMRG